MIKRLVCDGVLRRSEERDQALTRRVDGIGPMFEVTLGDSRLALPGQQTLGDLAENFRCQLPDIFDPITSRETA
jgi:hypothetical protein